MKFNASYMGFQFNTLEPGKYLVKLDKVVESVTKDGSKEYLNVVVKIQEPKSSYNESYEIKLFLSGKMEYYNKKKLIAILYYSNIAKVMTLKGILPNLDQEFEEHKIKIDSQLISHINSYIEHSDMFCINLKAYKDFLNLDGVGMKQSYYSDDITTGSDDLPF